MSLDAKLPGVGTSAFPLARRTQRVTHTRWSRTRGGKPCIEEGQSAKLPSSAVNQLWPARPGERTMLVLDMAPAPPQLYVYSPMSGSALQAPVV